MMQQRNAGARPAVKRVRRARRWRLIVPGLLMGLLGPLASTAAAPDTDIARERALRAKAFGAPVAEGSYDGGAFTVHFPEADRSGATPACPPGSVFDPVPPDVYEQRRLGILKEMNDIQQAHKLEIGSIVDAYYAEVFPEYNRRHDEGLITRAELKSLVRLGEADIKMLHRTPLSPARQARMEALERQRYRNERTLVLRVLHVPDTPDNHILPMAGNGPDPAFAAQLARSIAPFVATCGSVRQVATVHYYRDGFRPGVRGLDDGGVLTLQFRAGADGLRYQPWAAPQTGVAGVDAAVRAFRDFNPQDPEDNRELTLAGFRAVQADVVARAEARRILREAHAAEYRKSYATAEGRRGGVVYYLEPYWSRYEAFDAARRVFDGDFFFRDGIDFKVIFHVFADVYSDRCAARVPEFVVYRIPYEEYVRTDYNLDGSSTRYVREGVLEVPIDARFTPYWGDERSEVSLELMSRIVTRVEDPGAWIEMSVREFIEAMSGTMDVVVPEVEDVEAFFERHACDSATMEQMRTNLVRAARGQDAMQDAGVVLDGAGAESDPLPAGAPAPEIRPAARPLPRPDPSAPAPEPAAAHREPVPSAPAAARAAGRPSADRPAPKPSRSGAAAERQADARSLQAEIQAAQQAYQASQASLSERAMARLQAARTPTERMAIQREFVAAQRAAAEALQRQLADIRARHGR